MILAPIQKLEKVDFIKIDVEEQRDENAFGAEKRF